MLRRLALAVCLMLSGTGAFAVSAHAQSASGTTNLTLNLNPTVVLYYRSALTINLVPNPTSASNADAATAVTVNFDPSSTTSFNQTADVSVTSSPAPATTGNLQLNNFWAVRSISSGNTATTNVGVCFGPTVPAPSSGTYTCGTTTATATNSNGGTMTLSALTTGTGTTAGGSNGVAFNPTGLNSIQYGNVKFAIDYGAATRSGNYTGAQITVRADSL